MTLIMEIVFNEIFHVVDKVDQRSVNVMVNDSFPG